jgi:hypothetical protein
VSKKKMIWTRLTMNLVRTMCCLYQGAIKALLRRC